MRFDTKIAIAVRDDLAGWQRLNVTAFLASGIAAGVPETAGKPYEDGSGQRYLEMFRQPVLVFAADDDDDNRAAVRAVTTEDLNLAGVAVYGPRNGVDKVFKGAALHP